MFHFLRIFSGCLLGAGPPARDPPVTPQSEPDLPLGAAEAAPPPDEVEAFENVVDSLEIAETSFSKENSEPGPSRSAKYDPAVDGESSAHGRDPEVSNSFPVSPPKQFVDVAVETEEVDPQIELVHGVDYSRVTSPFAYFRTPHGAIRLFRFVEVFIDGGLDFILHWVIEIDINDVEMFRKQFGKWDTTANDPSFKPTKEKPHIYRGVTGTRLVVLTDVRLFLLRLDK